LTLAVRLMPHVALSSQVFGSAMLLLPNVGNYKYGAGCATVV